MRLSIFIKAWAICLGFSLSAQAQMNSNLWVGLRSRPLAHNFLGTFAYDHLLWGEKTPGAYNYGFFRVGARAGGSPTAAIFAQVSPIAPVILEVQQGRTHRFFKNTLVDCDLYECKGNVDRTDLVLRFAGAYENLVFVYGGLYRTVRTEDSTQPVYLELEYFVVSPGTHRYREDNLMTGFKLPEDRMVGVLASFGEISEGSRKSQSYYGFYRFPVMGADIALGAGNYTSDQDGIEGFGVIALFTMRWGESLLLF